jgi:hypothetical protein
MTNEFIAGYTISTKGRVYSIRRKIFLQMDYNSKGYCRVTVRGKHYLIHRLVAIAFIPNPLNLPQVNHKDGIKKNNYDWNLEWCNNQYNNQQSYLNGRISGRTRLSNDDARNILSALKDKSIPVKQLAKMYNVAVPTIYAIKQGLNIKRLL